MYEDDFQHEFSDETAGKLIDAMIEDSIKRLMPVSGIEGCEEVFRGVYKNQPIILNRFQEIYDRLIGRAKK